MRFKFGIQVLRGKIIVLLCLRHRMADRVRIGTDIDTDADIAAMGVSPSMSTDADMDMVTAMDTVEGAAIPTNMEPKREVAIMAG